VFSDKKRNPIAAMINNLPLWKKMAITMLAPIFFLAILALTALAVIESMSVIRTYVGGESLYSKYQKDAVIELLRYAGSHNEQDYKSFLKSIQVPLEARKARLELEKPDADIGVACQAFIQSQNHPEDAKSAAYFFRFFRHLRGDYFEKLNIVWAEADSLNVKLKNLGIELHETVSKGRGDKDSFQALQNRIYTVNRELLILENEFSSVLGEAARWMKKKSRYFVLILIGFSLALSILILFIIGTDVRNKTSLLKSAAKRVGAGHYETRINLESGDEFATIAVAFSGMAKEISKSDQKLKAEIDGRRRAEEALRKSRENLSATLTSIGEAVIATEIRGNVTFMNPIAEKLTGYTSGKAIGSAVSEVLGIKKAKAGNAVENWLERVLREGEAMELAGGTILTSLDGSDYFIAANCSPIRDHNGSIIGAILVFRDITEQHSEEKNMRLMQFSVEHSPEAVFWLRPDGRFFYVNEEACRSLGYSREELLSMSVHNINPEFLPATWPRYWKNIMERDSISVETVHKAKDGKVFPVEVTGNYLAFRGKRFNCAFARDITARKQAEKALQESERFFKDTLESMLTFVGVLDPNGKIVFLNNGPLKATDLKLEDIKGQEFHAQPCWSYSEETVQRIRTWIERCASGGSVFDEIQVQKADGSLIWCDFSMHPVFDEKGKVKYLVPEARDISKRKRIEDALRESEETARGILNATTEAVILLDPQGVILALNDTCAHRFQKDKEQMIGLRIWDLYPPKFTEHRKALVKRVVELGKPDRIVYEQKGRWHDVSVYPVCDLRGEVIHIAVFSRDITDIKQAEEQIHVLNQQMIKAQENERQMISCELHDVVAQDLSSAKITCDLLLDPHLKTTLPEVRQKIAGVSKALKKTISTVRDFSYELHPPLLDEMGLVRSVSAYCDDFSKHNNMIIDFYSAGMRKLDLDFMTRINLFRLIQEGLNNIKKHAHANYVTVRMAASFPNIALSLEDDGRGFEVERLRETALKNRQMGLGKMKERVGMLQGEMKIRSRPMQGTKIFIQLPYKKEKNILKRRLEL
jgi:PAS domain S-box-containing protein